MVAINASSPLSGYKLELHIKSNRGLEDFSPPIYIPTAAGFSKYPGCIETYTAHGSVRILKFDTLKRMYVEEENVNFPLSALEFGGTFQKALMKSFSPAA